MWDGFWLAKDYSGFVITRVVMMLRLLLPLFLGIARSTTKAHPVDCSVYAEEFQPVIEIDFLPWSSGISSQLIRDTKEFAFNVSENGDIIGACSSVFIELRAGKVYPTYSSPTCDTTAAWPWVSAFGTYFETVAQMLQDAQFVISTGDKTVVHEHHAHWNSTRHPVFHFCRSADTDDILVESHMVHMSGNSGLFSVWQHYERTPPVPWEQKQDVMFAAWTSFGRWVYAQDDPATLRYDEDGNINYDSRKEVEIVARKMNDSRIQINTNGYVPVTNWSQYKYIVHMDGVTCSNKIYESLLTGSLLIVEQSGYMCLPQAHLKPFVHYIPFYSHFPQELEWVWRWIQLNPEKSKDIAANGHQWALKYLTRDALTCRWRLLLEKYNSLIS